MLYNILRGVGICITRHYKGGGGVKNDPKKRYIIFEWPLTKYWKFVICDSRPDDDTAFTLKTALDTGAVIIYLIYLALYIPYFSKM